MPRRIPRRVLPNRGTTYRAYLGTRADGDDRLDATASVKYSLVEQKQRIVRSATGEEKTSSARVYLDAEHVVPEGSLVTVHTGTPRERTSRVVAVDFFEDHAYSLTVLYLE